jgi:hypothetical protein
MATTTGPGLLDRIMARRAYDQQFTAQAIPADRPDNLFPPVPCRYRAHGSFEQRARSCGPRCTATWPGRWPSPSLRWRWRCAIRAGVDEQGLDANLIRRQ